MHIVNLLPVSITPIALDEIRKIIAEKGIPVDYALRIGSRGSGCSGNSLFLGFDKQTDTDRAYLFEDIQIIIDKKHLMFVLYSVLDFIETEKERGFVFKKD